MKGGSYAFQVTATDPGGLTATSTLTVLVIPTATAIRISPDPISVPAGGTESLTDSVVDQFGYAVASQPASNWSIIGGVGSIGTSSGVYTAPVGGGSAVLQVAAGGVLAQATVLISWASPVGTDSTTEGTWIGTYGAIGYDVINSTANIPSYATVTPSDQSSYTWAATTTDPRRSRPPLAPAASRLAGLRTQASRWMST